MWVWLYFLVPLCAGKHGNKCLKHWWKCLQIPVVSAGLGRRYQMSHREGGYWLLTVYSSFEIFVLILFQRNKMWPNNTLHCLCVNSKKWDKNIKMVNSNSEFWREGEGEWQMIEEGLNWKDKKSIWFSVKSLQKSGTGNLGAVQLFSTIFCTFALKQGLSFTLERYRCQCITCPEN